MKLVEELNVGKSSTPRHPKNNGGRKFRRKIRTEEEQELINSLIKENNDIYKRAKQRGHATLEEKARCDAIREELMEMKAI